MGLPEFWANPCWEERMSCAPLSNLHLHCWIWPLSPPEMTHHGRWFACGVEAVSVKKPWDLSDPWCNVEHQRSINIYAIYASHVMWGRWSPASFKQDLSEIIDLVWAVLDLGHVTDLCNPIETHNMSPGEASEQLVDVHTVLSVFTSGTKSEKETFAGYGLRVFLRKWMVKHQKHQLCGSLWLFMVPQICWSSSSSSSSQDTWGARLRPGLTFSHLAQLDALGIPVLPILPPAVWWPKWQNWLKRLNC